MPHKISYKYILLTNLWKNGVFSNFMSVSMGNHLFMCIVGSLGAYLTLGSPTLSMWEGKASAMAGVPSSFQLVTCQHPFLKPPGLGLNSYRQWYRPKCIQMGIWISTCIYFIIKCIPLSIQAKLHATGHSSVCLCKCIHAYVHRVHIYKNVYIWRCSKSQSLSRPATQQSSDSMGEGGKGG